MENLYKKWPLSLFREDDQTKQVQNLSKQQRQQHRQQHNNSTTTAQQQQQMIDDHTDVVIFIFLVGPRCVEYAINNIPFIFIV